MQRSLETTSAGGFAVVALVLLNAIVLKQGLIVHPTWYKFAYITLPLLVLSIFAFRRKLI